MGCHVKLLKKCFCCFRFMVEIVSPVLACSVIVRYNYPMGINLFENQLLEHLAILCEINDDVRL